MKVKSVFNRDASATDFVKSMSHKAVIPLRIVAGMAATLSFLGGNFPVAAALATTAYGLGKAQDFAHSRGWDEIEIFDGQFKQRLEGAVLNTTLGVLGIASVGLGGAAVMSGGGEATGMGLLLLAGGAFSLKTTYDNAVEAKKFSAVVDRVRNTPNKPTV